MAGSICAKLSALRRVLFGDISGVYASVGTPFERPAIQVLLINNTDADLILSTNAVIDKLDMPAGLNIVLDIASNKSSDSGLYQEQTTQYYVKAYGALPTTGYFSLTFIYGEQ